MKGRKPKAKLTSNSDPRTYVRTPVAGRFVVLYFRGKITIMYPRGASCNICGLP